MNSKQATENQLTYIREMQEFSFYPLPEFKGTTEQEASEYIAKYWKLAHESSYGIVKGY